MDPEISSSLIEVALVAPVGVDTSLRAWVAGPQAITDGLATSIGGQHPGPEDSSKRGAASFSKSYNLHVLLRCEDPAYVQTGEHTAGVWKRYRLPITPVADPVGPGGIVGLLFGSGTR